MDKEMEEFQNDLLQSVRQMHANQAVKTTTVTILPIIETRNASGLTQAQFAALLGVSVRTIKALEQGQRQPSGAIKTLIEIAQHHPEVLHERMIQYIE